MPRSTEAVVEDLLTLKYFVCYFHAVLELLQRGRKGNYGSLKVTL